MAGPEEFNMDPPGKYAQIYQKYILAAANICGIVLMQEAGELMTFGGIALVFETVFSIPLMAIT